MRFKVGDRIAVYGTSGNLKPVRVVTVIEDIHEGLLHLREADTYLPYKKDTARGGYDLTLVHPMQCRKLKKKCRC